MAKRFLVKAVGLTVGASLLAGTAAAARWMPAMRPPATNDLAAPVAISATPAASPAARTRVTGEAPEQDDDTNTPRARAARVAVVATATGLSEAQVQALLAQGLGFGEIGHAAALSQATGGKSSVDAIVTLKTSGMGWGQIAHQLGVHPGVLGHGSKGARGRGTPKVAATGTPPAR